METLKHIVHFWPGKNREYLVPYCVPVPTHHVYSLIKKAEKKEKTTKFKIDGVSETKNRWIITITLEGDVSSRSHTIEKTDYEKSIYNSPDETETEEQKQAYKMAMATNNFRKIFGVKL